jgi:deazaflavin-dependent oxidoreductase (nitroreductase family)
MRRIAAVLAVPAAIAAALAGAAMIWRRNPRIGTAFMNSVLNPTLLQRGLAGGGRSEIAMLEHVGRRSGIKRLTPVHPEVTARGFRIIAPLGTQSQWARNVIAAGHCRMQVHDQVFELDEPALVDADQATDVPWPIRRAMGALGFKYLELRTFAAHPTTPGRLDEEAPEADRSREAEEPAVETEGVLSVR